MACIELDRPRPPVTRSLFRCYCRLLLLVMVMAIVMVLHLPHVGFARIRMTYVLCDTRKHHQALPDTTTLEYTWNSMHCNTIQSTPSGAAGTCQTLVRQPDGVLT